VAQRILTSYSQTRNLEQSQIQETLQGQKINDLRLPYSFSAWIQRNVGIIPGEERKQYDLYLLKWYEDRDQEKVVQSKQVREDYIALLKQISLAFQTEAEKEWVTDINWDDELEVEQVIPFYARKLKEIAIYIINKREAIKKAKLKYNMAGAERGLERLFYEYLLKAFTKRRFPGNEYITTVTEASTLNAIPELSATINSFRIEVEELYDDTNYFDRDPSSSPSTYFNLSSDTVIDYLTAKSFNINEFDWLYNTGTSPVCADNPLTWSVQNTLAAYEAGIPISALELPDSQILADYTRIALTEKFLGEQQYIISGGYFKPWKQTMSYPFVAGNNWFYWTSGEYLNEVNLDKYIDPVPLAESNLIFSGATGGEEYTSADVIFATRNNSTTGAWLQSTDKVTRHLTMSANLVEGDNLFNFPFPGFGISGEDIEWTGRALTNINSTFIFLDENVQSAILRTYWDTTAQSVSAFESIPIHETTLIDEGAYASKKFDQADQIIIRSDSIHDSVPDGVYTNSQQYAWLYKMDTTDIPVNVGTSKIYWPIERVEGTTSTYVTSSICIPMALSAIDISRAFAGATAGNAVNGADTIFKLDSLTNGKVINGAWLSGAHCAPNITGAVPTSAPRQPGVYFAVDPGTETVFIWEGSLTNADDVFVHYNHQQDCQYLKQNLLSLFKKRPEQNDNIDYNQWQQCTCKSVFYSPFGHPGSNFDSYDRFCDYIVSVSNPASAFNLETWTDSAGYKFTNSDEFGWYKVSEDHLEPDAGWSAGNWLTYNGTPFQLKQDTVYRYVRSNIGRSNPSENAPYFIAKYAYNQPECKWIGLEYDQLNDAWISTEKPTTLILTPGNYLEYTHKTVSIGFSASHFEMTDVESYALPDMSTSTIYSNLTTSGQGTKTLAISSPVWDIVGDSPVITRVDMFETEIPVFQEGVPFMVSGSFGNSDLWTVSTFVSAISTEIVDTYTFLTPPINFTINVELSGWNYSTFTFDGVSRGARPFWAKATDRSSIQTKYKGIDVWGGSIQFVDDYTPISQPEFSDIKLNMDTYLSYKRNTSDSFIWKQPLGITVNSNETKWNKLIINTDGISNLSGMMRNDINELIISGTNDTTDLVLDTNSAYPLLLNYFATSPFTWTQEVSDSSLGIPPTGGVWVPIVSGDLVTPVSPYAYLTNRHFPTVATVPYVGGLYPTPEVGGYFIPQMIGASTFLSKNRTHELNTIDTGIIFFPNTQYRTYQNVEIYNSNYGLTKETQLMPIYTVSVDSTWTKGILTESAKAGMLIGLRDHQHFSPYKTKYEIKKHNSAGIHRQGDLYDPWYQEYDNTWENSIDWPSNFRKENTILKWYDQFPPPNKQVYQWKTDIFTNEFSLLKYTSRVSVYEKRNLPGEIWTRDTRNIMRPGMISLSGVYDKFISFNSSFASALSANILDFDIWFDTIMIYIPDYILLAKLTFDYKANTIYTIGDNINIISLCGGRYGGSWFFEEDKKATVCTLLSTSTVSGTYFYPVLYGYDLNINQLAKIYTGKDSSLRALTSVNLTSIEDPVFTHNNDTNQYNVAFIGYNNERQGMYFTTININHYGSTYELNSYKVLTPSV